MAREEFQHEVIQALRELALSYPEVNEGDSCVKRSFKARSKGFLYLGEKPDSYNVMVKLDASADEARSLGYPVGSTRWATLNFANDETPPKGLLERWIGESYRLQAPTALIKELDQP